MDKRYQVFVSSTYADLKVERQSVIYALMEMDCIPAGMELFPAVDEEQFLFISKVIDDCDYYLVIIGGRYGSTTSEGLSYTEKEYDYARSIGLRVLAFIHESPESLSLKNSEVDPQLRQSLVAFKKKASTDTLVKLWTDAKELPGLVALSLAKTIKMYPAVGWVRGHGQDSEKTLLELNEVRKHNEKLSAELAQVKADVTFAIPSIPNIAGLDAVTAISGSHSHVLTYEEYQWSFRIAWAEIFSLLGPAYLSVPSDDDLRSFFEKAVKELYKLRVKNLSSFEGYGVSDQVYQGVKIQFLALKLVSLLQGKFSAKGRAVNWQLTPLGQTTLIELRAARTGE